MILDGRILKMFTGPSGMCIARLLWFATNVLMARWRRLVVWRKLRFLIRRNSKIWLLVHLYLYKMNSWPIYDKLKDSAFSVHWWTETGLCQVFNKTTTESTLALCGSSRPSLGNETGYKVGDWTFGHTYIGLRVVCWCRSIRIWITWTEFYRLGMLDDRIIELNLFESYLRTSISQWFSSIECPCSEVGLWYLSTLTLNSYFDIFPSQHHFLLPIEIFEP